MLPIGPLMKEHRLIEQMIGLMQREIARLKESLAQDPDNPAVNPAFLDAVVDFIRIYADKTHHGKEEDILFAECAKKNLAPEHRQTLDELLQEHDQGRSATGNLYKAKQDFVAGDRGAAKSILENLTFLVGMYPQHIDKEDNHFFLPSMGYFTEAEKDDMLARMWEFDRTMIHRKYESLVHNWQETML